jgi:hypothetical protein
MKAAIWHFNRAIAVSVSTISAIALGPKRSDTLRKANQTPPGHFGALSMKRTSNVVWIAAMALVDCHPNLQPATPMTPPSPGSFCLCNLQAGMTELGVFAVALIARFRSNDARSITKRGGEGHPRPMGVLPHDAISAPVDGSFYR